MKYFNHKITIGLLAAGSLFTSCDSYLEEENNSSISIETASSDPQTFTQLVATVYERSRETTTRYTPDMYYLLEDLGTDIITRGGAVQGTDDLNDYVNLNSFNWPISVYWSNQYSIISAANTAIDNADVILGVTDAEKVLGVGEAKFFRAWAYFKLVENYGGVPLVLNQVTTAETNYTRDTEEAVYQQIVSDLQDALTAVPQSPSKYGRVSKDAVRHLLSKVLLTRGYKSFGAQQDFTEAASLADAVISNHALVSSFSQLVSIDNQRNSEVIFSYLFGTNPVSRGWGNSRHMKYKFSFYDYPGMLKTVQQLGPMPTPFYYSLFAENDERAESTFTRVIYADEDYTATVNGSTVNVVAGDTAIYFPKVVWSQTEISSKPYKVINPGTYFQSDGVTAVHYPMFTKFDDTDAPYAQPDTPSQGVRDMVMMRSGEAYLIAAEAYLGSNDAITAAARLTTLRSRAGLLVPVLAADVNIDFILDERARELTGEVNRWMDLKRTGKLVERTLLHNPHAALNNALTTKHLLRPIPQGEIDVTGGSITQNPNYQ
ncbi:RagB/SusD family nutrient uptake outer membrane protein [Aestuariibaculum suncheonense]|uniref:RagB/SusD family nutrient uptake outer membrane protein n=1 Tax=Aestuariibaculum suncheonense TaxID=1028745 RepID=A0A8J6UB40_9FLAO|nr:RagB/SusD family nutrient uptake outer membrane protein [Aestuariibaculum suncheonense]MBD0835082.1 RagB/SusD family nutrient uptake outer membrane protein [Aestuariibaculum suncheonense]